MNILELIKVSDFFEKFWYEKSVLRSVPATVKDKLLRMHPKQYISNVTMNTYLITYSYETKRVRRGGKIKINNHMGEVVVFDNHLPNEDNDYYELGIMLENILNQYITRYNQEHLHCQRINESLVDYMCIGVMKPRFL